MPVAPATTLLPLLTPCLSTVSVTRLSAFYSFSPTSIPMLKEETETGRFEKISLQDKLCELFSENVIKADE